MRGKHIRSRTWYVNTSPDAALLDPELPALGSGYPADTSLTLDGFDVEHYGDRNATLVTGTYTKDRRGTLGPRVDDTRQDYKAWQADFQDVETVVQFVHVWYVAPPGNTASFQFEYDIIDGIKSLETQTVYQREVIVPSCDFQTIRLCKEQNNAIHIIDGQALRYKASGIIPREGNLTIGSVSTATVYTTVHTWISDPGTGPINIRRWNGAAFVAPPNPEILPTGALPPDREEFWRPPTRPSALLTYGFPGYADPETYSRSPFHYLIPVVYKSGPTTFDIVFEQYCPYKTDRPLGWQSLPGNPIP